MNKVHIEWVENKSNDWKIVTVTDPKHGKVDNVSVNRVNKKGETFPNFDAIVAGADIAGDLWQSPAGKWYLFEAKTQGFFAKKEGMGEKMLEKKAASIEKSQDRKAEDIKISSTFRAAVELAVAQSAKGFDSFEDLKGSIENWRQWLWQHYDAPESYPPFN